MNVGELRTIKLFRWLTLAHDMYIGDLARWLLCQMEADWHEAIMAKCHRERRVDEEDRHRAQAALLRHQASRLFLKLIEGLRPQYLLELVETVQAEFVRARSNEQRDAIVMFLQGEAERFTRDQAS